mgnify:CR=1 FL=1
MEYGGYGARTGDLVVDIANAYFAMKDGTLAAQAEALLNKSEGFALLDVTAQVQSASTVTERVTLQQTICREGTAVLTDRQNLLLQPGESRTVSFRYCVDSPALWSPENPNLYTSTMQVLEGEEVAIDISRVQRNMMNDKPKTPVVIESIRVDTQGVDYPAPEKM